MWSVFGMGNVNFHINTVYQWEIRSNTLEKFAILVYIPDLGLPTYKHIDTLARQTARAIVGFDKSFNTANCISGI